HIAPWSAAEALFRGAARTLPAGGLLYLYGPFKRGGQHTAESNQRFDERLRGEDPRWGVRDLDDVTALAASVGFGAPAITQMPANNLSLVFRRALARQSVAPAPTSVRGTPGQLASSQVQVKLDTPAHAFG